MFIFHIFSPSAVKIHRTAQNPLFINIFQENAVFYDKQQVNVSLKTLSRGVKKLKRQKPGAENVELCYKLTLIGRFDQKKAKKKEKSNKFF